MTGLTDELLRRRLAERASATPVPALGSIARSVAASPRRRAGRWPILGSVAACTIVAVALIGGLFNRTVPPPAVGPSIAATESAGSTSALASASPQAVDQVAAWAAMDWRRLSNSEFPQVKSARVSDAVAFGDGFVAVGTNGSAGRIWRSVDGMTWSTVDADWLSGLQPSRIVTVGDRLVLFGQREGSAGGLARGTETWSSSDGVEWVPGPAAPIASKGETARDFTLEVVGGPLGVLVRGDDRTFLLGPDLTAWTDVTYAWPADVEIRGLAAGDRTWIQPGATGIGDHGISTGAIWTSTDGRTWSKATIEDPGGVILEAFSVAGGFVALGSTANVGCRNCFGVFYTTSIGWFSADGNHWARMIGSGGDHDDRIFGAQFAGDGRRLLAFADPGPQSPGSPPPKPIISETVDGRAWTSIQIGSTGALPAQPNEGLTIGRHGVIELPGGVIDVAGGAPAAWWGQAVEAP
jgi:hypothetical protein